MGTLNGPVGKIVRLGRRNAAADTPVGIVGLGAIGTSIGLSLNRAGIRAVGLDVSSAHLEKAVRRGAIERAVPELERLGSCDPVFVAVPPSEVPGVAGPLLATGDATVVDVASVKAGIAAGVRNPNFVPSHPLRGTHLTGPEAARVDLFDGGVWVICSDRSTPAGRIQRLEHLVRRMGALPVRLTPAEHDSYLAVTSHLPHLVASSLVHLLGRRDPIARALVGTGFLDTTRVARANPALWADIAINNHSELSCALDELIGVLASVSSALRSRDARAVEGFFSQAAQLAGGLPALPMPEPATRTRTAARGRRAVPGRYAQTGAWAMPDGA